MADDRTSLNYREAGVNIDAANQVVRSIGKIVRETYNDHVLRDIGSFGAMYSLDVSHMDEPVLVSSIDGVGTKLKVALMVEKYDTIGIDLVSHCVNDILVQGARPLFFLDYLACSNLDPAIVTDMIRGVARGCRYAGCALVGGEMAEMRDIYRDNEYDLAGCIVGVVDRQKIIDGSRITDGDIIIGLASSGLHTNGYSLARQICFEAAGLSCSDEMPGTGRTVGDALLEPHRSYAKVIQLLMKIVDIKGMVHVTGGGITDNVPRVLPDGLGAEIELGAWEAPPLFWFLKEAGNVDHDEMMHAFNMGVGYVVIVGAHEAEKALDALTQACEEPKVIGRVVKGADGVQYSGALRYASPD